MIFTPPSLPTLPGILGWGQRLTEELNRFHPPISLWPVFEDDAAALAGQLKVGDGYVTPEGIARRVMP
jgi:hypothetical protein